MNSPCYKIHRSHSKSCNLLNGGEFSGDEFLRTVSKFWKRITKSLSCVFKPCTKREIGPFHVVVVQWQQRNVQKSVMHVHSCWFANQNLLLFSRSRCCRRSRWLSSLILACLMGFFPKFVGGYRKSGVLCEISAALPSDYCKWNVRMVASSIQIQSCWSLKNNNVLLLLLIRPLHRTSQQALWN